MFRELNTLKLFFEYPSREFSVREVARLLKISPATASKELKKLAGEGILKSRKLKNFSFFKADLESERYRDMKLYYNLRKIRESGLLESINRFYLRPTVVLFGSAASGMDTETSDFDLLIVSEKTAEFPEKVKFERKLSRKLQLFAVKDIRALKNEHLMNSAMNGITIQGEVEWIWKSASGKA